MAPLIAVVIFVALLGHARATPLINCEERKICDHLWTAAEGAGADAGYYRKGTTRVHGAEIKVGDVLVSEKTIYVRRKPAYWAGELIKLPPQTTVTVKEIASLPLLSGGNQVWLRINNPDIPLPSTPTLPQPPTPPTPTPPTTPSPIPPASAVSSPCLNPPDSDAALQLPLEVLPSPPVSSPPTNTDLARLISGREMYCDQSGLIIHRHAQNGTIDGGDTAQREGFYWVGVWLRENIHSLPKWDRKRKLTTLHDVIPILEGPNKDGRFHRYPTYQPDDQDWGFSIDQFVPLVAAMGLYGETDALQRLFAALPEDMFGRHTFNGHWVTFPGGMPGVDCSKIKEPCDAADCPLQTDSRDCAKEASKIGCNDPISKPICELGKQANKDACIAEQAAQNAIYQADQARCVMREALKKGRCELNNQAKYQACFLTERLTSDLITPSVSNLMARALKIDPHLQSWSRLPDPDDNELVGDAIIRVHLSEDRDKVGDDLNMLVHLVMAKLFFESPNAKIARLYYMKYRRHSYGSYMRDYYAKYGPACPLPPGDEQIEKDRMWRGIDDQGFLPDTNAVLGAIRWYNRPCLGANPELARLWEPIIEWLRTP